MRKNFFAILLIGAMFLGFIYNYQNIIDLTLNPFTSKEPLLTLNNFSLFAKGYGKVLGKSDPLWLTALNLEEGSGEDWKVIFAKPTELSRYDAPINLKYPIKFTDKELDDFVARRKLKAIIQTFRDSNNKPVLIITSLDNQLPSPPTDLKIFSVPVAFNLDGNWFAIPLHESVRLIKPIFYLSDWWQENRIWFVGIFALLSIALIIYIKIYLTPRVVIDA